jgi:hypothetical protein
MRTYEVIRRASRSVQLANGQTVSVVKETSETVTTPQPRGKAQQPAYRLPPSFQGANRIVPMGARFPR